MTKTSSILAISAAFVLMAAGNARAEYRIATVEINRVLNESKEAKSRRKELDELTLKAKKKIEEKRTALKAMEKSLTEARAKEDSKEAEKFRLEARNFNLLVKDSEEDLKKEFLKSNKDLTDKALKLVADYAQHHDLDLVLDKGEKGRSPVLYGDASYDVTDDIIKEINK